MTVRILLRRCLLAAMACLLTCLMGFETLAQAQQYHLVEPTGVITADVYFTGGQMIVNDANGTRYVFRRDRYFDSFDRQYVGYIHPALNRVVRWPRSGQGLMQVTDLDDAFPHYIFSRRSVRRVRRGGGRVVVPRYPGHSGYRPPPSAYIPPTFNSPYGFNGYGLPAYGYVNLGPSLNIGPIGGRPRFSVPPIQSMVLDSKVVPRPPLPPATLQLRNTSQREIVVTITDRAAANGTKQVRIAGGGTVPETFQRDAGADRVKTVRRYAPDGSAITQEVRVPLEPQIRYEIVVHERRVQSVSIDRTGKSPNVIEDVQFQGRGLGRFELPPGEQLQSGNLDVVATALGARNQGSVAPIREDSDRGDTARTRPPSSLEELLLQQQRASGN